jgi:hypothetical protein
MVAMIAIGAFLALALVLWLTSGRPGRWLERRYWRRRQQQRPE